jgi:hypothetical protein
MSKTSADNIKEKNLKNKSTPLRAVASTSQSSGENVIKKAKAAKFSTPREEPPAKGDDPTEKVEEETPEGENLSATPEEEESEIDSSTSSDDESVIEEGEVPLELVKRISKRKPIDPNESLPCMNPENFDPEIHVCNNRWTQVQLARYKWKKARNTYVRASKPPAAGEPGSEEYVRLEWTNTLTGAEYLKIVKPSKDEANFVPAQLTDGLAFDFAKSENYYRIAQSLSSLRVPLSFTKDVCDLMANEKTSNRARSYLVSVELKKFIIQMRLARAEKEEVESEARLQAIISSKAKRDIEASNLMLNGDMRRAMAGSENDQTPWSEGDARGIFAPSAASNRSTGSSQQAVGTAGVVGHTLVTTMNPRPVSEIVYSKQTAQGIMKFKADLSAWCIETGTKFSAEINNGILQSVQKDWKDYHNEDAKKQWAPKVPTNFAVMTSDEVASIDDPDGSIWKSVFDYIVRLRFPSYKDVEDAEGTRQSLQQYWNQTCQPFPDEWKGLKLTGANREQIEKTCGPFFDRAEKVCILFPSEATYDGTDWLAYVRNVETFFESQFGHKREDKLRQRLLRRRLWTWYMIGWAAWKANPARPIDSPYASMEGIISEGRRWYVAMRMKHQAWEDEWDYFPTDPYPKRAQSAKNGNKEQHSKKRQRSDNGKTVNSYKTILNNNTPSANPRLNNTFQQSTTTPAKAATSPSPSGARCPKPRGTSSMRKGASKKIGTIPTTAMMTRTAPAVAALDTVVVAVAGPDVTVPVAAVAVAKVPAAVGPVAKAPAAAVPAAVVAAVTSASARSAPGATDKPATRGQPRSDNKVSFSAEDCSLDELNKEVTAFMLTNTDPHTPERDNEAEGNSLEHDLLDVEFTAVGSSIKISKKALLDTGTRGANLISSSLADSLLKSGLASRRQCNVEICGAFNTCKTSKTLIKTTFFFKAEQHNKNTRESTFSQRAVELEAVISDTGHADLIIGRESIKTHNFVRHAPRHFVEVSEQVADRYDLNPLTMKRTFPQRRRSSCDDVRPHGYDGGPVDTSKDTSVPHQHFPQELNAMSSATCFVTDAHTLRGECECHERSLQRNQPVTTSVNNEYCSACSGVQGVDTDEVSLDTNNPHRSDGQGVPATVKAALIVSKAALLQGEPDDDEIDIPAFSFENDETFDDIMYLELENEVPSFEQLSILRQAFVDGCFSKTVKDTPIVTKEPMILKVNEQKWLLEKRNKQPPRPQSHDKQKAIFEQIDELLEHDCIEESQASSFSQVHMVRKKDGKWRFCIDFRGLNDATESNSWTIPNIKLLLQRLGDRKPKYFAVMDLTAGYFQAPIDEKSRQFTAFRTARGTYQWKRVPMGLKGAGSYFQAAMANIIGPKLLYNGVEVYLDDVIVYGATEAEYLSNLKALMQRFKEHNVSLSPKKCKFGLRSVEYVGHLITDKGISFSEEKRRKVFDFPEPLVQKHLKSFLGLANYFRDHIADHSSIAVPLQKMVRDYKKSKSLVWTPEARGAFKRMKDSIADCQTLWWMDDDLPVYLHTDASDFGVGAYLFQVDKNTNKERPIHFLSKSFSDVQTRWSTIEKECYAIFYAMTSLEHLVRDRHFTLRTDHRNLLFINSLPSAKVTRWKLAIQEYDFQIEHIPGKHNMVADQMSRLCAGHKDEVRLKAKDVAFCLSVICACDVRRCTDTTASPTEKTATPKAVPNYPKIPEQQYKILCACHNEAVGHLGVKQTLQRVVEKIGKIAAKAWPGLKQDTQNFVASCAYCQKASQVRPLTRTEPYVLSSSAPMRDLAIDTIGPFPPDKDGNIYICSIIDCFSRYVQLYPTSDCTAEAAAESILKHFALFGVPDNITSDNGTQFINKLIKELSMLSEMDWKNTTPYSHEENGISERSHKETLRHLRAVVYKRTLHRDWGMCVPIVQRIMNSTPHGSTGFAPSSLITPAIDLNSGILFPVNSSSTLSRDSTEYIKELYKRHTEIVALVQKTLRDTTEKVLGKRKSPDTPTVFLNGSYVLCSFPDGERPQTKLNLPWQGPFQVVSHQRSEYVLRDIVENKETKRVHVSRLKTFIFDPNRVVPLDVARRDNQELVIESILAHEGVRSTGYSKTKDMKFLVHWLGSEDSWEPWRLVRRVPALHRYLERVGLARLIPKEFC